MKKLTFIALLLCGLEALAYQASSTGSDIIAASENVNGLFLIFAQLFAVAAFIIGVGFIVISIAKYRKRKKIPTFIPMQTVVMMFLGGVFLIFVGIMYYYTGDSVLGPDYLNLLSGTDETLSL